MFVGRKTQQGGKYITHQHDTPPNQTKPDPPPTYLYLKKVSATLICNIPHQHAPLEERLPCVVNCFIHALNLLLIHYYNDGRGRGRIFKRMWRMDETREKQEGGGSGAIDEE